MRILIKTLKALGVLLLVLASILIVVGIVGVWMTDGFSGVRELLNPFNIANFIVTALALAPGIGLIALANMLEARN